MILQTNFSYFELVWYCFKPIFLDSHKGVFHRRVTKENTSSTMKQPVGLLYTMIKLFENA